MIADQTNSQCSQRSRVDPKLTKLDCISPVALQGEAAKIGSRPRQASEYFEDLGAYSLRDIARSDQGRRAENRSFAGKERILRSTQMQRCAPLRVNIKILGRRCGSLYKRAFAAEVQMRACSLQNATIPKP